MRHDLDPHTQTETLCDIGVTSMQGWLFARALTSADLIELGNERPLVVA